MVRSMEQRTLAAQNSVGTAFKLEKNGTLYRVIVGFSSNAGDATGPQGGVALGTNGLLYGTTRMGVPMVLVRYTISITMAAAYVVLHSFSGTNGDETLRGGSDCSQAMAGFMVQLIPAAAMVSARFSK